MSGAPLYEVPDDLHADFDVGRHLDDKAAYSACYAPMLSMYFDQFGNARACCQNTDGLLGNVRTRSIRQIWESAAAERLRGALEVRDFSAGCGFCRWQADDRGIAEFARTYDEHPVVDRRPSWPLQMEFALTNACNLQCVMCNGDWSSSIRANREHRSPLPQVYGDDFFDQLAEFLPHLAHVSFAGGEPFLGAEPLRVMEMLAELPSPPLVTVITNGTQWSPRVRAICERLPISFKLSLDGISEATYEAIRIGADFGVVMENLDRFLDYARRHGTGVSLTHCLMVDNWTEFADLLHLAEAKGLDDVSINEVLFPAEHSLYQLPPTDLEKVVASMERDPRGAAGSLRRFRHVWDQQLGALRKRLHSLENEPHLTVRPWAAHGSPTVWVDAAGAALTEWAKGNVPAELRCIDGVSHWVGAVPHPLRALDVGDLGSGEELVESVRIHLGATDVERIEHDGLRHDRVVRSPPSLQSQEVRIAWAPDAAGFTAFVAERYQVRADSTADEPPPDDPATVLSEWSNDAPLIRLKTDAMSRVVAVEGDLTPLRLVPEEVCGERDGGELLGALERAWGGVELRESPSGFAGDVLVALGPPDSLERAEVRVIIPPGPSLADPDADGLLLVAVRPWGGDRSVPHDR